jgi:hypothetical protein
MRRLNGVGAQKRLGKKKFTNPHPTLQQKGYLLYFSSARQRK